MKKAMADILVVVLERAREEVVRLLEMGLGLGLDRLLSVYI